MNDFFEHALSYLFQDEGKTFTNNPMDPGGPTKFGITLKAYESHMGHPITALDIELMTEEAAKDFYEVRYWAPLRCGQMASQGIAICIFDTAVLYGQYTAIKTAQMAVSLCGANLKFDGLMGDKTLEALNTASCIEFVSHYRDLIMDRIGHLIVVDPTLEVFRKGWTNRANRLLTLQIIVPVINKTT